MSVITEVHQVHIARIISQLINNGTIYPLLADQAYGPEFSSVSAKAVVEKSSCCAVLEVINESLPDLGLIRAVNAFRKKPGIHEV